MKKSHQYSVLLLAISGLTFGACGPKPRPIVQTPPAPQTPVAETRNPTPTPQARPESAKQAPVVPAPKPTYPDAATRARIDQLLARIEDAYFDYDKATLRSDAIKTLAADATELKNILKDYPDYKLTIEGHADERGSAEYNLALGEKRAAAAKEYLVQIGIPSGQLSTVSYGKERPACSQSDESCWQKNRRIHIVAVSKTE